MNVELITHQDLEQFRIELLNDIKAILSTSPQKKKLLRAKDVRKILQISAGTLQTLRINGTLPFSKIGGITYYDYDDILKVMEKTKRNS